jgi:ABC-type bacteriocin/lantibiotic exporter with double-glycine peptidase domain
LVKKPISRGARLRRCPSLLILISFLIFGCAGISKNRESGTVRIIENVPFYPQESFQCGPASLAGILNYWGVHISPGEIAAEIYSPGARGTLDLDMVLFAEKKGLKATQYEGSWEDLKRNIQANQPLVVLVDEGFWVYQQNHFMVAVGYDKESLIVNSGKDQHQWIPRSRFLKSWERTNFWTLRITPK